MPPIVVTGHHQFKPNLLLKVEQGYLMKPPTTFHRTGWKTLVENAPSPAQPKVVIDVEGNLLIRYNDATL
jgi:hypothetical protein